VPEQGTYLLATNQKVDINNPTGISSRQFIIQVEADDDAAF
jgi:hypothetical protein